MATCEDNAKVEEGSILARLIAFRVLAKSLQEIADPALGKGDLEWAAAQILLRLAKENVYVCHDF